MTSPKSKPTDAEILALAAKGVGPASIAVRLSAPMRRVEQVIAAAKAPGGVHPLVLAKAEHLGLSVEAYRAGMGRGQRYCRTGKHWCAQRDMSTVRANGDTCKAHARENDPSPMSLSAAGRKAAKLYEAGKKRRAT